VPSGRRRTAAEHAYELFYAQFLPEINHPRSPARRLAAIARAYGRFAGTNRPLFEVLYGAGLDNDRHPEVKDAERPLTDAFLDCVRVLTGGTGAPADDLAAAVEATAHGHAMLLLSGDVGQGNNAIDLAAERAARATLALVESRHLLTRPSRLPSGAS
jgi:hypothetical protein